MSELWSYEQEALDAGFSPVCGCDEAGAGPLAGPVYAAAVVLPQDVDLPGLNDSKQLSAKQRDRLFDLIQERAVEWSVASVDAEEIDKTDILSARMKAMQLAINGLKTPPLMELVICDGVEHGGVCPAAVISMDHLAHQPEIAL